MEPIKITQTNTEFAELEGWLKEVLDINNAKEKFNKKNCIFKIIITNKIDNQIKDFKLFDDGDTLMNNIFTLIKILGALVIILLLLFISLKLALAILAM